MVLGTTGHPYAKINKKTLHPSQILTQNRSKGLNVKFKPIDVRFLKDNVGRNLMTLFWCLNITPKTINERTNKLDFIKTKCLPCKYHVKSIRRQTTDWEKNICRRYI